MPVPLISLERRDLALEAGRYGRVASVYNLLSDCASFGLSLEEAQQVIDKMVEVVKGWRELFVQHKVEERTVEYISGAILPECFFRMETIAAAAAPTKTATATNRHGYDFPCRSGGSRE